MEYISEPKLNVRQKDILLVDEVDHFAFSNPVDFGALVQKLKTIAFTATIPDQDLDELEARVLRRMQFKMFEYNPSVAVPGNYACIDETL